MHLRTQETAKEEDNYRVEWARQELLEKMQAGRAALSAAIANAPRDQAVLTNGWTARDWLAHLGGWEVRIADAYLSLAAGETPVWDLDRLSLDEVNALILEQAGDTTFAAARAGEERAYQRLLEIARTAPGADLFEPNRFAWMKSVPFAEWIGNNTYEHVEEHLLDWNGGA